MHTYITTTVNFESKNEIEAAEKRTDNVLFNDALNTFYLSGKEPLSEKNTTTVAAISWATFSD